MAIQVWQGAMRDIVCDDEKIQAGDIKFKGERVGVLSKDNARTVFFEDGNGKIAVCLFRSDREETDQAYVYVFPSPVLAKLFFREGVRIASITAPGAAANPSHAAPLVVERK